MTLPGSGGDLWPRGNSTSGRSRSLQGSGCVTNKEVEKKLFNVTNLVVLVWRGRVVGRLVDVDVALEVQLLPARPLRGAGQAVVVEPGAVLGAAPHDHGGVPPHQDGVAVHQDLAARERAAVGLGVGLVLAVHVEHVVDGVGQDEVAPGLVVLAGLAAAGDGVAEEVEAVVLDGDGDVLVARGRPPAERHAVAEPLSLRGDGSIDLV